MNRQIAEREKTPFRRDQKFGIHQLHVKKKKTGWVLVISGVAMILEILFGHLIHSMALLSNGWHMSTHIIFIGISWLVYQYVMVKNKNGVEQDTARILAYVGFVNALIVAFVAVKVGVESIGRYGNPVEIKYDQAILVAFLGGMVNVLSAKILHHDEAHSDYNLKATYLHLIADVLTAVLTLVALLAGLYFHYPKADAIVGVLGALVIFYWAMNIILHSGKEIFIK